MQRQINQTTLEVLKADITTMAVDAIVNAANVHLQHGGGVALAIVRRGGQVIQDECDALLQQRGRPLEVGEAVLTGAGRLPAKFVIHVAGPIWGAADAATSDAQLRAAVRNSLALADQHGLTSIAFPAISTGIYRFPLDRAARLMLSEVADYLRGPTNLRRVVFCLFDDTALSAFSRCLAEL